MSIERCVFSVKAKLHANSETFLRPFQRSIVADSLSYACVCALCVCGEQSGALHSFCHRHRRSVLAVWLLIVTVPGSSAGWQLYCRSFRTVRYALPQLRIVVVQRAYCSSAAAALVSSDADVQRRRRRQRWRRCRSRRQVSRFCCLRISKVVCACC